VDAANDELEKRLWFLARLAEAGGRRARDVLSGDRRNVEVAPLAPSAGHRAHENRHAGPGHEKQGYDLGGGEYVGFDRQRYPYYPWVKLIAVRYGPHAFDLHRVAL
jgi:hypothetical protein